MLETNYPNSFFTKDNTKISFNTNFPLEELDRNKPLIIFNYGLVCSQLQWKYQVPFLEESGYQILLHDYRAHFSSSGEENIETCTYKNIVSDLEGLLNIYDTKCAVLIGHSMGVNICLEFAKKHPEKVKGLILISGSVFPPSDVMFDSTFCNILMPFLEKMAKKNPSLHKLIMSGAYKNPLIRKIVKNGGFNPEKINNDFVKNYLQKISELPPMLFFQLYNEMQNHNIINSLENINAKTLILGGDKDNIIPNYLQYILKTYLKNSELYIIKDGSHVPQADFPETVNDRIHHFLIQLENKLT